MIYYLSKSLWFKEKLYKNGETDNLFFTKHGINARKESQHSSYII